MNDNVGKRKKLKENDEFLCVYNNEIIQLYDRKYNFKILNYHILD